ncbi:MAG: hypothetical protein L6Q31_06115 [Fimbriimonadaceae bacterium]|nr:hypothetical protein [Fimbriimonadaceae bacterium]NUM38562.1 hypothetical protein [Armatimonadota bacterium]
MALLIIGTVLVSGALTYALWVKVRVMCLRQDIYDARDWLFDLASKEGALQDPAYVDFRERLNVLARTAQVISFPLMAYALEHVDRTPGKMPEAENRKIQGAVDKITEDLGRRIQRYLFWETAAGWVLMIAYGFAQVQEYSEAQSKRGAVAWVKSDMPSTLLPARG